MSDTEIRITFAIICFCLLMYRLFKQDNKLQEIDLYHLQNKWLRNSTY